MLPPAARRYATGCPRGRAAVDRVRAATPRTRAGLDDALAILRSSGWNGTVCLGLKHEQTFVSVEVPPGSCAGARWSPGSVAAHGAGAVPEDRAARPPGGRRLA